MKPSFSKTAHAPSGQPDKQPMNKQGKRAGGRVREHRDALPARPDRRENRDGGNEGDVVAGERFAGDGGDFRTGKGARERAATRARADGGHDREAPLLPGIKPVCELLQSAPERVDAVFLRKGRRGREVERIVDLCRAAGVRFSLLEPASFARVYEGFSQGVVARLFEAGFADLNGLLEAAADAPLPLLLALDQVQDPGNAGTLARTLYALGGAGLVVPRHNGVYLGAAAAKAAAGALDKLAVAKAPNLGKALDGAKKQGFTIYGAVCGNAPAADARQEESRVRPASPGAVTPTRQAGNIPVLDLFSLVPELPAVVVLGSEEDGMRSGLERRCDFLIRIPLLRDFDSLNVAQAGGIIISWFAHWVLRGRSPAFGQ